MEDGQNIKYLAFVWYLSSVFLSPQSKYPPLFLSPLFYPPMILSPSIEELFYPPSQNIPLIISPLSKYPLIAIYCFIPSEYPFQYFYPPYYIPPLIISPSIDYLFYPPNQKIPLDISPFQNIPLQNCLIYPPWISSQFLHPLWLYPLYRIFVSSPLLHLRIFCCEFV